MLATHTSREQRIADLEIHGWVPVVNKGTGRAGIYNTDMGVGFSTSDLNEPWKVKYLTRDQWYQSYEPCSWDEVTDWHLDAIDARLGAT